jgi:hypothetical protein
MSIEKITCTRQELFEQVWSQPVIKLAETYGLSDVGLRKLCKRHNIPLPPQGYWARKRRPSKRPPLLPQKEEIVEIHFIKKEFAPGIQEGYKSAQEQAMLEKQKDHIHVPAQLRNPHPLVAKTVLAYEHARQGNAGIFIPRNNLLDITVSPKSLNRALRIMDALIKALEARGHSTSIEESHFYRDRICTFANIGSEKIEFRIQEKYNQIENKGKDYPRYILEQSGQLVLSIDAWADGIRRRWADGKKQKLEDCLNSFIASLIMVAAEHKARRLEREREERERLEHQRILEEKARLKREEAARVKALEDEAEAWYKSNQIRAYIKAAKETIIRKHGETTPEQERWLIWAEQQVNRLDPLTESPPSILDDGN